MEIVVIAIAVILAGIALYIVYKKLHKNGHNK